MLQNYFAKSLVTGSDVLLDQWVVVEDGVIKNISPTPPSVIPKNVVRGHYLIPSFIDLQIYGASGKLFSMYPSVSTLRTMYEDGLQGGTSQFLVTVATNAPAVVTACIDAVNDYWKEGGKGVIGLHLEGPWINKNKRGAHLEEYIKNPTESEVSAVLDHGKDVIKMITVAPEVCGDDILKLINSYKIIISAGHSNATFAEASSSFAKGISSVTHMFNAMSSFHHRDTGLPGATFAHPTMMSSIIVDGFHVDYAAVKIAKRLMKERLFLITDAVTETKEGPYPHTYNDGRYMSSGILSGSALSMIKAVQNCVRYCDIPAEDAFRMASLYPAKVLKLHGGTITLNQKASFLLLDENLAIINRCI